ncbi:hypothetical protein BTIS_0038 [Bifidobacterium tissieri]|uniref:Uncharacterized protein n=1 Tax=Bifidobacterium tissieri TaxID=1630162 RepID=A0A261FJH4_9BIFI|nr:hypothetical protein BTIS_0038 [Bifidobacterium tissieri]
MHDFTSSACASLSAFKDRAVRDSRSLENDGLSSRVPDGMVDGYAAVLRSMVDHPAGSGVL